MSMLREARERVDTRERDRGRGRGSQVQYYDDMGFSSTEQGHEKFVEYKSEQAKNIAEQKKQIAGAQSQINKANQEYQQRQAAYNQANAQWKQGADQVSKAKAATSSSGMNDFVNNAYKQALGSNQMVKARVVNGNNIEASYWVPRSIADKMIKEGFMANYVDDGRNFNVEVKQGGRIRGKELHEGFTQAQQSAKTQIMQAAQRTFASQAAKAKGQIAQAESQLSAYKDQLNSAKGGLVKDQGTLDRARATIQLSKENLANYTKQEQKFLVDLQQNYQGKVDRMREIMGNLKAEEGVGSGTSIYDQLSSDPTMTQQIIQGQQVVAPQPKQEVV